MPPEERKLHVRSLVCNNACDAGHIARNTAMLVRQLVAYFTRSAPVLLLLLVACGNAAPKMAVGQTCTSGDLTVELEQGYDPIAADCAANAGWLRNYEDEYDARFGHQGWVTVRLRVTTDLRTTGVSSDFVVGGHTYDDGVIDLARAMLEALPHELNHVRTGTTHLGWCRDYEPWSEAVLGWNQGAYLGCPQ